MSNKLMYQYLFFLLCICIISPFILHASEKHSGLSKGQVLYVPAYSHIYSGNREAPFLLTVTLSIRNVDPKNQIKIMLVDYYETQGKLLKNHIDAPIAIKPLGTFRFIIPEKDKRGGSGANFIIEWRSDKYVNPPIVETIMISTKSSQGISFTSRAREIIPSE